MVVSIPLNARAPAIAQESISATSTAPAVASTTSIRAIVTMYSGVESCHYPGCPMASGKRAYVGAVACPSKYKFGTKIKIGEGVYTCEDRTASWIQKRNGPTFDIFAGYDLAAYRKAIHFGKVKTTIEVMR